MINFTKKKTAFSAIEISVVLIAIGLLITGIIVVKGDLYDKANSGKIASLTKDSPVIEISDLALWLEAGTKNSFKGSEFSAGSSISEWKDINPQKYDKMDVVQATPTNKPTYVIDPLDGMPAISFDGGDTLSSELAIRGFDLAQNNQITIFLVQKYNSPNHNSNTIFWQPTGANEIATQSLNSSGDLIWDFGSSQMTEAGPSGFNDTWNIVTLIRGTAASNNGFIRINGAGVENTTMSDTLDISASDNLDVGVSLNGSVREIIIFKRQLTDEEIAEIEEYLSKKWEIVIN